MHIPEADKQLSHFLEWHTHRFFQLHNRYCQLVLCRHFVVKLHRSCLVVFGRHFVGVTGKYFVVVPGRSFRLVLSMFVSSLCMLAMKK